LLAEFIGMAGLTFILSGGAAILARYDGHPLQPWQTVLVLSAVSALWLVVAVYFLGDISAHFNPATTLAFALRRDMDWVMAGVYWVVQFAAAACGSLLARGRRYPCGHLPVTAGRYASASQLTVARRAVWADARTWAGRKDRLVSHPHLTRIFIVHAIVTGASRRDDRASGPHLRPDRLTLISAERRNPCTAAWRQSLPARVSEFSRPQREATTCCATRP